MKNKYKLTIILASIMILLGSYLNAQVTLDEIEDAWTLEDKGPKYFFEGFTVSVLGGVRSEAMKVDSESARLGTTGFKTTLQGQGVSVLNGFGYTFGLQVSYATANYYRPPSDMVSSINISIRNYEFATFFGACDHKHNMVGLLIGGGKSDTRKYTGYWNFGIIGAMNLPIFPDKVYLGLQPQIGLKTNQLSSKGSNFYTELLINCQIRL